MPLLLLPLLAGVGGIGVGFSLGSGANSLFKLLALLTVGYLIAKKMKVI